MSSTEPGVPRPLIASINGPADVKKIPAEKLPALSAEIRDFLVESVAKTGGHLGPNLGVVELTVAIHRVFDSPRDTIVFDTGHQAYVHKLLTGRKDFSALRQRGGLSGYPSRSESAHDVSESSHASAGLSWADGIAKANQLTGHGDRSVIAVVGDGALTGGMAWEALNNIAADSDRRLIIVVNDNGRSYAPTTGGLANHLDALRTTQEYERVLDWGKRTLRRSGPAGRVAYDALHGLKKGIKDVVLPQGMFEDLGLKYIGPVNGHNVTALESALSRAKSFGGPVIVHAITEKGRGYTPAEDDVVDRFHAVGVIHPETGLPVAPSRFGWTGVFADEIVRIARKRADLVAITAAMLAPVGLAPFAAEFPTRVFDVGIAEQHALTSAAGMAFGGLHPVVAMYATFLNRGFDQILMDIALHKAPVTVVLDRAGITGEDGPSHHGIWDLAMLRIVPGMQVAAPRDEDTLRRALRRAIELDGPSALRYPKGEIPRSIPAIECVDGIDVLARHTGDGAKVLMLPVGSMVPIALAAAGTLADDGVAVTVADPGWVLPVSQSLVRMAAGYDLVISIEDGVITGGVGDALAEVLSAERLSIPVRRFGVPGEFIEHSARKQLLADMGLTPAAIAEAIAADVMLASPSSIASWEGPAGQSRFD